MNLVLGASINPRSRETEAVCESEKKKRNDDEVGRPGRRSVGRVLGALCCLRIEKSRSSGSEEGIELFEPAESDPLREKEFLSLPFSECD